MGFSAFRFAKSLTRPGWDTDARSGGLPPCTAVESTVGVLSPVGLYLTETFGYFFLNPSSTAWKFFCSSPVQTPLIEIFPLTAVLTPDAALPVAVGVLELLPELLPPQPAAT